ncbi:hypothetical protein MKEN_00525100 [Mycena kentingensis (nom. inval.)]|nr:hypothetical protein MKEN_00525100 [Mycena kentingensis (nom. inval.)]
MTPTMSKSTPDCETSKPALSSSSPGSVGALPPTFVSPPPTSSSISSGSSASGPTSSLKTSTSRTPSPVEVPSFVQIVGVVFALGDRIMEVPQRTQTLVDIVDQPETPIVIKSVAIDQLLSLLNENFPLVLRRPPGFGIDTFAAMVAARLDESFDHNEFFSRSFNEAPPTHNHTYRVLVLDFNDLEMRDDCALLELLFRYCYSQGQDFFEYHQSHFKDMVDYPSPKQFPQAYPHMILTGLAAALEYKELVIIIHNFDATTLNFPPHEIVVLQDFLDGLEMAVTNGCLGGLLLLSTLDDGTVYPCLGRRRASDPIRILPRVPGIRLNHALDLSHQAAFQGAVGFTEQDIDDLDAAYQLFASPNLVRDSRRLVEMVQERHNPTVFTAPPGHLSEQPRPWNRFMPNPLGKLFEAGPDTGVYPPMGVFEEVLRKYGRHESS